jgi:3-deoxy-D-manno-octulosonate 8-phosphate phosphatase (KDO 8-P phosphatase)
VSRARPLRPRAAPLSAMRLLVLDVDGVLTDGRLLYGGRGEIGKSFHARDGYGIRVLQDAGVMVAVISGRRSMAVQRRCRELGIRHLRQSVGDKGAALDALLGALRLQARHCTCVGDDEPDVPMLRRAGLAVAVADAHPSAIAAAHRRTRLPGGAGAVREVCDWLLQARGQRTP